MLGEFFQCPSDGLDQELIGSGPSGRVAFVSAPGMTPVNIARLGELLGLGTYVEILAQCGVEHHEAAGGESGVWSVPAELCRALATWESLEPVAHRWVATEELQLDGWRAGDGVSVLAQLSELLRREEAAGTVLWYWWSL